VSMKLFPRLSLKTFGGWVRLFRVLLLLLLLLVIGTVFYLHEKGLPQFVKTRLVATLRERGWDVQFTNMRLGIGTSVIIDKPSFHRLDPSFAADISASRTDIHLDPVKLLHGRINLSEARILRGQFRLPADTNGNTLSVTNVNISLQLMTNDTAELTRGRATFHNVNIVIEGRVSNYSALPSWPIFHTGAKTNRNLQASLARFADVLNQISFSESPSIHLRLFADGKKPEATRSRLLVGAKAVHSPWVTAKGLRLSLDTDLAAKPMLSLHATGDEVIVSQGSGTNIDVTASLSTTAADTNLFSGVVEVTANAAKTRFSTNWVNVTNLISRAELSGYYEGGRFLFHTFDTTVSTGGAESRWGSAKTIRFTARGDVSKQNTNTPAEWGPWLKLRPFTADWGAEITDVESPKLAIQTLSCAGHWKPPSLTISQIRAKLYDGNLQANASVNVDSRRFNAEATSDFDPMRVSQVLTTNAQRWLKQFTWQQAPKVNASCTLVLPQWTNRHPAWRTEVMPTLQIAGKFTGQNGTFRDIPVDWAASTFSYTNRTWDIPDLLAKRDGGQLLLHYTGSDVTHEYRFLVESDANPLLARPVLPPSQQHWFDELKFTTPPHIHAEVRGRWKSPELTGFSATVRSTNFWAHNEKLDVLNANVEYTNFVMKVSKVEAHQQGQVFRTPSVVADFRSKSMAVTNVYSTLDTRALKRVLGPKTPVWMNQMEFFKPPDIRVSGFFCWTNPLATDIHFNVGGTGYRWTNIVADTIKGDVYWQGRNVLITNLQASAYGAGRANGWGTLTYKPKTDTNFRFDLSAVDVELPLLARSFTGKTNNLEGKVDLEIHIKSGNSKYLGSINGYGYVSVHDALLWDLPMFGMFSPMLNAISPGAGNSRAYEAKATYAIVNGNIYTDDLEIRATGYRLFYKGSIGLDKHLDAKVEAQLLRDTAVLGPILRYALAPLTKLFEYHITGTINHPMKEPMYVPKFLMMILRPFHTIKQSIGDADKAPPNPEVSPKQK
ncbi:MAG: hypothetical protein JWO95_832, partial [Verrucomicrobiales bacterium]|nr:hypothetical protein [Verrucomicrobiales bacterium]